MSPVSLYSDISVISVKWGFIYNRGTLLNLIQRLSSKLNKHVTNSTGAPSLNSISYNKAAISYQATSNQKVEEGD